MSAEDRTIQGAPFGPWGHRMPTVEVDPDNWAHGPWTALAVTLAEPLRQAFYAHLDHHGCTNRDSSNYVGGFAYCEEASALFALLPAGDRIIVATGSPQ